MINADHSKRVNTKNARRFTPGIDSVQAKILKNARTRGSKILAYPVSHPNGELGVMLKLLDEKGQVYRSFDLMVASGIPKTFSTHLQANVWLWNALGTSLTRIMSGGTSAGGVR